MTGPDRTGLYATIAIWLLLAVSGLAAPHWLLPLLSIYFCYGIFAMGLSLIWGQAGILSFGQAIFFGAGAYAFAVVTLGMVPGVPDHFLIGVVAAVVVSGGLAAIAAWMTFAGRGLSGAHFAIVTLCAAVVVETAATRSDYLGGYNGLFGVPPISFGGEDLGPTTVYFVVLAVLFAVFAGLTVLVRSPFGTVLRAIRNDENRTAHLGYDTRRLKSAAFVIAGAVSGLAGALFASQFGFVSPSLIGFALSTQVLIWVAVGGRAVLMASVAGAIIVPGAENLLSAKIGNIWQLAIGLIFVVTVIVARDGAFGRLLRLPEPQRLRRHGSSEKSEHGQD